MVDILFVRSVSTFIKREIAEGGACSWAETTTLKAEIFTPSVQSNGLVAYYPFDGNADDASGNENHGTVYEAGPTTDRFDSPNSAYEFDGIDDYIDIGNDASLNISSKITIRLLWKNDENH